MFSEAVTVITVNVTLLDDNALEGDEDFKAQLSTSSGSNVILPSPEAILTIVDDDSKTSLAILIRGSCQSCDLSCWLLTCITINTVSDSSKL